MIIGYLNLTPMSDFGSPGPPPSGIQYPGAMPCGTKMPVKRVGNAAALAAGVCAGIIESRNGKAKVTPAPRKNARRGMCFFVINILLPLSPNLTLAPPYGCGNPTLTRCPLLSSLRGARHKLLIHLELLALHHSQHQGRKLVVILLGVVHDGANLGHIEILGPAA